MTTQWDCRCCTDGECGPVATETTTNTPPPVGNYIAVCACGREFEARRWRDGTSTEQFGCGVCASARRSAEAKALSLGHTGGDRW